MTKLNHWESLPHHIEEEWLTPPTQDAWELAENIKDMVRGVFKWLPVPSILPTPSGRVHISWIDTTILVLIEINQNLDVNYNILNLKTCKNKGGNFDLIWLLDDLKEFYE